MPCFTMLPGFPGDAPLGGHAWVPVDDNKVWTFGVSWHPKRKLSAEELALYHEGSPTGIHSTLIPGTPIAKRNKSNGYVDENSPPGKFPFQRITIFQDQDTAVTESIGAQFDRTKEFLVGSDIVVVQMRRRLVAAARELEAGVEPPNDPQGFRMRGYCCVLPKDVPSWSEAVADALDARPETFKASV
jgi:phthalate 4,5-dioxygenase